MRMECLGNSSIRVGADHEAPDTGSITELRVGVTGPRRRTASWPVVLQRRIDMVVPATPIVPRNEDHRGPPKVTLTQFVDALGGPLAPQLDRLLPSVFPVRGMLGKLHWTARGVDPGHVRQFPRRHVCVKSSPRQNIRAAFQLLDFLEITEARVPVSSPSKFRFLQCRWQRRNFERLLWLVRSVLARIIDYRGGRRDEHQMVGFGLAGHFREVVVTQRKLSRE